MTAVTVGSDMLVSDWIAYDEEEVGSVIDILRDWKGISFLKLTLRGGDECYLNPKHVQYVTIERRNTDTVEDIVEKAPTFRDLVAAPLLEHALSYRGRGG